MRPASFSADAAEILRRAARLNDAARNVHTTYERRDLGRQAFRSWKKATRVAQQAHAEMYPPDFWRLLSGPQADHEQTVEALLVFLEADPWCDRSGYAKEWIARSLRRLQLTPPQRDRLEVVLLHLVDVGDRREFSDYCKVARGIATPSLRVQLKLRLTSNDEGVRRRALVMLTSLRHPRLDVAEVAVAREIVLQGARWREESRQLLGEWVARLAAQFSDDEWAARLARIGVDGGVDAAAALRVLGRMHGVRLSEEHRREVAHLVLSVIDSGDDESWFEALVPLVDSAELRAALEARAGTMDADVARRVYWARNGLKDNDGGRAPNAKYSGAPAQDPPPITE